MKKLVVTALLMLTISLPSQAQSAKKTNHEGNLTITCKEDSFNALGPKEFIIEAKEDTEIQLNIMISENQKLTFLVYDSQENLIISKEFDTQGNYKLNFESEHYEKYRVVVCSSIPAKLSVNYL